ncbi:hypothetical protein [Pseudohoeflea coraliihabitans]|uniref:NUDIX hydrolase n=1 Tax=Pseudohoeflea coraliihabitans TaxID=2860393 RepID=A0ABS6WJ43_9HYPH|nr:hypothetical protein [Pseudohoeflea sp. DP4N28-3]MBW3095860.1 hypothetical protein [Pseudohoeflea sp. DP4N28-3]
MRDARAQSEPLQLTGVDLRVLAGVHPWYADNRVAIERFWAEEVCRRPFLYNGFVVLFEPPHMAAGRLTAKGYVTPYAGLLYFLAEGARTEGAKAAGVCHLFGAPALSSSDGALLLVRMAARTANAGRIYAPSGSLDDSDVVAGRADLNANMQREVFEETGLDLKQARAEPGFLLFRDGAICTLVRRYHMPESAAALERRVRAFIAQQDDAEIDDVVMIGAAEEISAAMPSYIRRYIEFHFVRS